MIKVLMLDSRLYDDSPTDVRYKKKIWSPNPPDFEFMRVNTLKHLNTYFNFSVYNASSSDAYSLLIFNPQASETERIKHADIQSFMTNAKGHVPILMLTAELEDVCNNEWGYKKDIHYDKYHQLTHYPAFNLLEDVMHSLINKHEDKKK